MEVPLEGPFHFAWYLIDEGNRKIYADVLDNNPISIRIGRMELGGLWESTKYCEEGDWKVRGGMGFEK